MDSQDQMAWRVRSSKFRHVFGTPSKKEQCYECIKITKNAHDSNYCAVNPKFLAIVTECAGGGAFLVLPLNKTGRVDINSPKVCGHSGLVLDVKWNPFNDHVIASCSDDTTVKLWQIPEEGLTTNLTEWMVDLHGHQRRVGFIEWHPTAENILLSAGYDFKCILWNTETAEPINIISVHNDTIFSLSWSRDGSLFATTCKDKKIRLIEPREGVVIAEATGHQGTKASKVVFISNTRLFTVGFSKMNERQYGVWDMKNFTKPLKLESIDSSSGVLFPYYDYDTKVVFLAGKGDGNIRYYELVDEAPYCHYLSQYQSGSPQRGLGYMPKRGVDPRKCEIVRFYKLHAVKGVCEPVAMIVPRKSEMFQDDIFPPTASACPSLTADEWLSGQNREPILVSLKDGKITTVPESRRAKAVKPKVTNGNSHVATTHRERRKTIDGSTRIPVSTNTRPRSPKAPIRNGTVSQIRKQFTHKDGALTQAPTITTYKAVKRGASVAEPSSGNASNKRNVNQAVLSRMASLPASVAPPSPDKFPASIRNIKRLSGVEQEEIDVQKAVEELDNVTIYDTKRPVSTSQSTTRMTNANEPLRVDKKVWSSAYTSTAMSNANDPASNAAATTTNGIPKTDPEPVYPSSRALAASDHDLWGSGVASRRGLGPGLRGAAGPFMSPTVPLAQEAKRSGQWPGTEHSPHQAGPPQHGSAAQRQGYEVNGAGRGSRVTTSDPKRRNPSGGSNTSDNFVTPPTSPLKYPGREDISPVANTVERKNLTWASNPTFNTPVHTDPPTGNATMASPRVAPPGEYPFSSPAGRRASPRGSRVDTSPLDDILRDVETLARDCDDPASGSPSGHAPVTSRPYTLPTSPTYAKVPAPYSQTSTDSGQDGQVARSPVSPRHHLAASPGGDDDHARSWRAKSVDNVGPGNSFSQLKPSKSHESFNGAASAAGRHNNGGVAMDGIAEGSHGMGPGYSGQGGGDGEGEENPAMIDYISMDAPDNTLVKPSKLRASMRSRRNNSFRDTPSPKQDAQPSSETQAEQESSYLPSRHHDDLTVGRAESAFSRASPARHSSYTPQRRREVSPPKPRGTPRSYTQPINGEMVSSSPFPGPRDTRYRRRQTSPGLIPEVNNNTNHLKGTEALGTQYKSATTVVLQDSPTDAKPSFNQSHGHGVRLTPPRDDKYVFLSSSPDVTGQPANSTAPGRGADNSERFTFKSGRNTAPHESEADGVHPWNSKSTNRSQEKYSKSQPEMQDINSSGPVRRVFTVAAQHAPPDLYSDCHPDLPGTDPELRKAYFRQLEETRSLKEQITLKDKRIRQLETEVRNLRASGPDESNC